MVRPSCAPLLDGIGWNTTPRGLYYRRRSPNSLQSPRGTLGPGPNGAFPRYGEWFRLIDGCLKSLMSDSLDKIESELLGSAQERLSGEGARGAKCSHVQRPDQRANFLGKQPPTPMR